MFGEQDSGRVSDQQFSEGTPVLAAGGDKVGTVSEHNVQGGYLVMHKGWLFPQDVYVPLAAIERAGADGVYLRLSKDEIQAQDWSTPPAYGGTEYGAQQEISERTVTPSASRFEETDTQDVRVPVMEEELVAGTRQTEAGHVRLHKEVVEEQQTVSAPVMHEEVRVERVPVTGDDMPVGADAFAERDIDVPLRAEELVTEKRAHVVEEVRLHKDAVTENERVTDTVRKERVSVDEVDASGRGADSEVRDTRI